jgi:predicted amino acid-binding ACT domain protein
MTRIRSWTHELTELAALFLTVGAAHLLANVLGHQEHGPVLLVGAGVALVLLSLVARIWFARRRRFSPRPGTVPEPTGGLWRIRTTVRDTPGELARLTAVLARNGVNILGVQLYPLADGVADEFVVEAPPWLGATELEAAVRTGDGARIEVTRAHVRDLADLPTRVLTLAARVVSRPGALAGALGELCGPCTVIRLADNGRRGPELEGTTMRLRDGNGGVLVVTRPLSEFTPAEYARARALVELTAAHRANTAAAVGGSSGA